MRSFVQIQRRALSQSTASSKFKGRYGAFIGGKEIIDGNDKMTYKLYTPHSLEYLCDVENTSEARTNEAIEIAHKAYESGVWSKADVKTRAKVLNNIADLLRKEFDTLLHYEVAQTGRPIKEMRAQVRKESISYVKSVIINVIYSYRDCLNGLNILQH